MGFTNQSLVSMFENIIGIGTTSSATSPTQLHVIGYLNLAQGKVSRQQKPQELYTHTPLTVTTAAGIKNYAKPATIQYIDRVFVPTDDNSHYREAVAKNIGLAAYAGTYFSSSNEGVPNFVDVRGGYLLFDKAFDTSGRLVQCFGWKYPTDITVATLASANEFDNAYQLLIMYEAAIYWYLSDDDKDSVSKMQSLAKAEAAALKAISGQPSGKRVELDPNFFKKGN